MGHPQPVHILLTTAQCAVPLTLLPNPYLITLGTV